MSNIKQDAPLHYFPAGPTASNTFLVVYQTPGCSSVTVAMSGFASQESAQIACDSANDQARLRQATIEQNYRLRTRGQV